MYYYVYEQILDGEVFYIGSGSGKRVISFDQKGKQYNQFIEGRKLDIKARIIQFFEDEEEARDYKRTLIKEYKTEGKFLTNFQHYMQTCAEKNVEIDEYLDEYIGIPLKKEKKDEMVEKYDLRNPKNGRQLKWTSIKRLLIENDYKVEFFRGYENGKKISFHVIKKDI